MPKSIYKSTSCEIGWFLIDGFQFLIDGNRFLIDGFQFLIDGLSTGFSWWQVPSIRNRDGSNLLHVFILAKSVTLFSFVGLQQLIKVRISVCNHQ